MIQRCVTGILLILALGVCLSLGTWAYVCLCLVFLYASAFEMFRAFKSAGCHAVEWPCWVCAALMPYLFYRQSGAAVFLPVMLAGCMLAAVVVMFRREPKLQDALASALPVFCVLLPGMLLISLANVPVRYYAVMLELLAIGVPLTGDIMAYLVGRKIGKTPLCPPVSPHKTVEGSAAGLLGSVLFAAAIYLVYARLVMMPPLWHFLVLGLLGGFFGQGGDLFASLIKRHCGVKDFGSVFPGHGGFLDRIDSPLWAGLVFFLYLNLNFLPIR